MIVSASAITICQSQAATLKQVKLTERPGSCEAPSNHDFDKKQKQKQKKYTDWEDKVITTF